MPLDGDELIVVAATRLEALAVRRAAPGLRVVTAGVSLRKVRVSFDAFELEDDADAARSAESAAGAESAESAADQESVRSARNEKNVKSRAIVSCGLAGGLRAGVPTGTVVVPDIVLRPDGGILKCDEALVDAFEAAAKFLGYSVLRAPMLTSRSMITGRERAAWARSGYAAADMETGLLVTPRLASAPRAAPAAAAASVPAAAAAPAITRIAAVRVVLDTPEYEVSPAWLHPASAILNPRLWSEMMWLRREAPRCARIAAAVLAQALTATVPS